MSVITLENVHKTYPLGKQRVEAVKGVSFSVEKGEFSAISGPSGSGKSTILNMVGLIDLPTDGKIIIDGIDVYDGFNLENTELDAGRLNNYNEKKNKKSKIQFQKNWTAELQDSAVHILVLSFRPSILFRF